MFKVPQTAGAPGWIVFTYENDVPVCVWITAHECRKLKCIVDERICGDTIFKVERVGPTEYALADVWMFNGNCVFACSTFKQRYDWARELLNEFFFCVPGVTIDIIHKGDIEGVAIRGYESYSDDVNARGCFEEADGSLMMRVKKMALPDCYEVEGGGYLRVPTLAASKHLASLGPSFQIRCKKADAESWLAVI